MRKEKRSHLRIGQVTYTLNCADKLTFSCPSSASSDSQEIIQLKHQVQSLVKFVQTLLPPDAWTDFSKNNSNTNLNNINKDHNKTKTKTKIKTKIKIIITTLLISRMVFILNCSKNVSIRLKLFC